jgi:hypothetical protein
MLSSHCGAGSDRTRVRPSHLRDFAVLQSLWRGYAAVVGGIIIVTVSASDRRGSTVIAWRVISTGGGSADGSGTEAYAYAYRHSTAYRCTTINATTINADATNANATNANTSSKICGGVS